MSNMNLGRKTVQTGRQTNACPLWGRKAVYRADSRRLCKENVKQTALAQIGSFDLDRPWSGAERMRSNWPKKVRRRTCKTRFKGGFKTDKK